MLHVLFLIARQTAHDLSLITSLFLRCIFYAHPCTLRLFPLQLLLADVHHGVRNMMTKAEL